jgi:two-component system, OmpR family, sensor kinase
MFAVKDTVLNEIEKKSFYSFLFLYLASSLLFVLLSGYWYYSAQKSALDNTTYYKLQHLADKVSSLIINAHMMGEKLILPDVEEDYEYILIPTKEHKVYKETYFQKDGFQTLVSSAPQEHLMIEYVVARTKSYHKNVLALQKNVSVILILVFLAIVIISWILSKLFMRPVHQKMIQIEQFIQDISHELNTPITALTMSSKRAMQKQVYDEKILRNISISTKQLYSIYKSLAYLNFSSKVQNPELLELKPLLEQSVEYYAELTMAKNIKIQTTLENANIVAVDSRMELLFSNLISNAIKYSMPDTTIRVELKQGRFLIKDEGVGIQAHKIQDIFKAYERNSNLAGGFGVGLSIVKEICDTYGIDIEVQSELGVGSSFILSWK